MADFTDSSSGAMALPSQSSLNSYLVCDLTDLQLEKLVDFVNELRGNKNG